MKRAYQFRYMNENDKFPESITIGQLITGEAFANKTPIYQLGIQALPGTKFYLNGGIDPVIIGSTGIFELDLEQKSAIGSLRFSAESMKRMITDDNADNRYLIVDIIYEGEGA